MSMDSFLKFLQQILTMVDPKDDASVALARSALTSVIWLAKSSKKADSITIRSMMIAEKDFGYLVLHSEDFSGVPGEYQENQIKRQRLSYMIAPGC